MVLFEIGPESAGALLVAGDELDDHLLQIISQTEFGRLDIGLGLPSAKLAINGTLTSSHCAMAAPADRSLRTSPT
jgi:hypothetical protein